MAAHVLTVNRPILMLVTEPGPRLVEIVREAVEGGVDIVQWRDKSTNGDELSKTGRELRAVVPAPVLLMVNGPSVVDADGVHLPEAHVLASDRSQRPAILGRSIHSAEAAKRAEHDGLDYVMAGNVFETGSHPGKPAAGLDFLASVCRAVSIPVIAIGGITPQNTPDCLRAGAAGIAVLSTIMRANDPRAAASAYRAVLDD